MPENLFDRVIKGLEACIRKDCENCEYYKNFIYSCDRMLVEARELILEQQHNLETLQNFYDKQEESIWGDTCYDKY
jgi:hypothetical protein